MYHWPTDLNDENFFIIAIIYKEWNFLSASKFLIVLYVFLLYPQIYSVSAQ